MNTFNRVLVTLLCLSVAAGSFLFLLAQTSFGFLTGQLLHLLPEQQQIAEDLMSRFQQFAGPHALWWMLGTCAVLILAIVMMCAEIGSSRPPAAILLHHGENGSTTLDIDAISEIARWFAEDVDGVERVPLVQAARKGKGLVITGLALINPFANATQVVPRLQQAVQGAVEHACGMPVRVQFRSRFHDVRHKRKVR